MKFIALITVSLLSLSSFAETNDFSCNKQNLQKIQKGDKQTITRFLYAVAEYNIANEALMKKIEEQKLLRDIDKGLSSITENHKDLLPSESLNVHSSLGDTRNIISSLEDEQNKEEADALNKRFIELEKCEAAYLSL